MRHRAALFRGDTRGTMAEALQLGIEVTDEQKQAVIQLLKDKKTSNEIAKILGVSRNAVCGLKHRYNNKSAEKIGNTKEVVAEKLTQNRINKRKLRSIGKVRLTSPMKFRVVTSIPEGSKKIHRLKDHECKYAVTSHDAPPSEHRFCAKPRMGKSNYCEEHHKLCHETVNDRKARSKNFNTRITLRLLTRFNYI